MRRIFKGLSLALGLAGASLLAGSPAESAAAPEYDLLIRGGRVLDPASDRDEVMDVAIRGSRIARIAAGIDPHRARSVVDASGMMVTPGLVDIHTHVFFGTVEGTYLRDSYDAMAPDTFAPRSCTTTVVDAGSSGHRDYDRFARQTIAHSKTRVLAFLNIVGGGMRGGAFEQDLGDMDARATADAARAHADTVVGIKVAHYSGPQWDPVDRAILAARLSGTRVMVDFGEHVPELSLEDLLLHRLGPGDIYTHVFADIPGRTPIVGAGGRVRPYVREARRRGVIFDLGHGHGSFSFDQAVPALGEGFLPDSISSDMYERSWNGAMEDLPAVLSKLHALGMSVPDLVRRTTINPAAFIGRPELGRLVEGGCADVAVMSVESGLFGFGDTAGRRIEGTRRLSCELTVRAGRVLWDRNARDALPYRPRPR